MPFLGDRYGEALEKGDLKLAFDPEEGGFSVWHFEHRFPVNPLNYPIILDRALAALPEVGDEGSAEVLSISERLRRMGDETNSERMAAFPEEAEGLKRRLAHAVAASSTLKAAIDRAVTLVNGFKGHPDSFGALHRILEAQAYRLAHWRVAASDINYRRFFDVNSLAGLKVEDRRVFEGAHAMLFRQIREGRIDGLRIDHIDGSPIRRAMPARSRRLWARLLHRGGEDPGARREVAPLADRRHHRLRRAQPDRRAVRRPGQARGGGQALCRGDRHGRALRVLLRNVKGEILETSFASELEVLTSDLKQVADADRRTRDFSVNALRQALSEIIARFPVYRSYLGSDLDENEIEPEDLKLIGDTVRKAKRRSSLPDRSVHDFAQAVLLGRLDTEGPAGPTRRWCAASAAASSSSPAR